MEMTDKSSKRYLQVAEDLSFIGSGPIPLMGMTQHAAVADALTRTGALWFLSLTNLTAEKGHGHPLSDQTNAFHTIAHDYKQPYSTVVCVPDSVSSAPDLTPIAFPVLPNANPVSSSNGNISYPGCVPGIPNQTSQTIAQQTITREQVYNLPHSTTDFILHWIDLNIDAFNGSSIGAIVQLPRAENNATQELMVCNLSAGWGTAALSMHTMGGGISTVSSRVIEGDNHTTQSNSIKDTNIPGWETTDASGGRYFDYHLPYYPRQLINISREWAEYLNPTLTGLNTTVFNTILQQQIFSCSPRVSTETALVSMVVNGLATIGAGSQLQGSVRTKGPNGDEGIDGNYWLTGHDNVFEVDNLNPNWVKFRVDSTLEGYGYNASKVAPRLAIAILMMYCLLALGHLIYASITGKSLYHSISFTRQEQC